MPAPIAMATISNKKTGVNSAPIEIALRAFDRPLRMIFVNGFTKSVQKKSGPMPGSSRTQFLSERPRSIVVAVQRRCVRPFATAKHRRCPSKWQRRAYCKTCRFSVNELAVSLGSVSAMGVSRGFKLTPSQPSGPPGRDEALRGRGRPRIGSWGVSPRRELSCRARLRTSDGVRRARLHRNESPGKSAGAGGIELAPSSRTRIRFTSCGAVSIGRPAERSPPCIRVRPAAID